MFDNNWGARLMIWQKPTHAAILFAVATVAMHKPAFAQPMIVWPFDDFGYPEMHDEFLELRKTLGPHWVMYSKTIDVTVHWDEKDYYHFADYRTGRLEKVPDSLEALNFVNCYYKLRVVNAHGNYAYGFPPPDILWGFDDRWDTLAIWVGKSGNVVDQTRSHLRLELLDIAVPSQEYRDKFADFCAARATENRHYFPKDLWNRNNATVSGGAWGYDKLVISWLGSRPGDVLPIPLPIPTK